MARKKHVADTMRYGKRKKGMQMIKGNVNRIGMHELHVERRL
jgi:hypothetical protein